MNSPSNQQPAMWDHTDIDMHSWMAGTQTAMRITWNSQTHE